MLLLIPCTHAQKYFTREGKITFNSEAPLERIEAVNNSVTSIIDLESGQLEFAVLIKAFQFEKALMQEHFNENYMESSKYPKATFRGAIQDFDRSALTAEGEHPVSVAGDMTIHGVTKAVSAEGRLIVRGETIEAFSTFELNVPEYDIKIPGLMSEKIAETVTLEVNLEYEPYTAN